MALTPAMEDYLEAILKIKQQHGYVRCVDVAEQLGVKKPNCRRAVGGKKAFRKPGSQGTHKIRPSC